MAGRDGLSIFRTTVSCFLSGERLQASVSFEPRLLVDSTSSRAPSQRVCTSLLSASFLYLWPSGWRVRMRPSGSTNTISGSNCVTVTSEGGMSRIREPSCPPPLAPDRSPPPPPRPPPPRRRPPPQVRPPSRPPPPPT